MSMCVWNRRQILREILEEKARHKRQAEADALAKREEIAGKAPVYAGLERELALIRMELSRQALAHPEQVNSGELDEEANAAAGGDIRAISAAHSAVRALVIPANEELGIARRTHELLSSIG